jgi:hypothetical protein
MKFLLKSASYLFHPLWMPFAGTLLYFLATPRFFPIHVVQAKILAIAIMKIFIPVIFYFMLKTMGKTSSFYLNKVEERRWPLLFSAFIDLLILKFVLDYFDYPELYYFFLAIFISTIAALLMAIFRFKVSLHMLGIGGVTTFLILLSIHFNLSLVFTISFMIAMTGLTASSRLEHKAHSTLELALGLFVGILPQIAAGFFWL